MEKETIIQILKIYTTLPPEIKDKIADKIIECQKDEERKREEKTENMAKVSYNPPTKKPEGRELVEDYIASHSEKYLVWDVSESELRKIEDAGYEFIIKGHEPTNMSSIDAARVLYCQGRYIWLRLKDTPA